MPPTTPTLEPTEFTIGESLQWNLTDATFPPSEGWVLTYAFHGPTPFSLDSSQITPDTTLGLYKVRVAPSVTQALSPGTYQWQRKFTSSDGTEVYIYPESTDQPKSVLVRRSLIGLEAEQTEAELQLANYKAARDSVLTGRAKAYSIGGRSFTKLDLPYLNHMIGMYSDMVRRERAAARNGKPQFGRRVVVAFPPTSF